MRLLGEVGVARSGRLLTAEPPPPLARTAFAVLVLAGDAGVTTEELSGALWGGERPDTWASSLRTHVARVRRFLDPALPAALPSASGAAGRYRLLLPDDTVVDVEQLRHATARARAVLAAGDPARARAEAEEVVRRMDAGFLPHARSDWARAQRAGLAEILVEALEVTSAAAGALGDAPVAAAAAHRAAEQAPRRESAHRHLITAHLLAGDRLAAMRAYHELRSTLSRAGLSPAPETERLAAVVLEAGPAPSAPPAGGAPDHRRDVAPFVGRRAETDVLVGAWRAATEGAGGLVLVTGEEGIGKTRLVRRLAEQVVERNGWMLTGRCDRIATSPLQPFVEALDPVVAGTPADELPVTEARLSDLAAVLPSLATGPPSGGPVPRARSLDAVVRLVEALAYDEPALLVLDDVHWADEDSAVVLRQVVRQTADGRLLVVATARDQELAANEALAEVVGSLTAEGLARRLPLGGLAEAEVAELAAHLDPAGTRARAQRLVSETAGNPRFLVELLRHGEGDGRLPAPVRDAVTHRLDRLGADALALLRAAAVLGRTFPVEPAGEVAGLDEEATLDALERARDAGIVTDAGDERYAFAHELVLRVVTEGLTGSRRRSLHRRAAAALEVRHAAERDAHVVAIARHRAQGAVVGSDAEVVRWLHRAAAHARSVGEVADEVQLLREAHELVPPGADELGAEVHVELGLALARGGDHGAPLGAEAGGAEAGGAEAGGAGDEGRAAARAVVIDGVARARACGRSDLVARAALALARQAAAPGPGAPDADEIHTAATLLDMALEAGPVAGTGTGASGDIGARLLARRFELGALGPVAGPEVAHPSPAAVASAVATLREHLDGPDGPDGPDRLEERRQVAHELDLLATLAGDPAAAVVAAHHQASVAAVTGAQPALDRAMAALQHLAEAGEPRAAALVRQREAAVASSEGRFADALAGYDGHDGHDGHDGDEVGARMAFLVGWLRGTAGPPRGPAEEALVAVERGEPVRARVLLSGIALGADPLPAGDGRLHALAVAALAAVELGDPDVAAGIHRLLQPHAEHLCGIGYRTFAGTATFHLGRLAAVIGELGDAERLLTDALTRHLGLEARPWAALAQHALADVLDRWRHYGERDAAAMHREEATMVAADLGLRPLA